MSKYLNSCLHYLVNDYQELLSEQESFVRLKDSALVTNKHCLLDAKSNLLRYIVSGGNNTEAIELFNKIIVEQESKQLRNLQQVHKKSSSFAIIKSKNFEMKPKYFHTTTTKPELLKKLKIKDRELGKLRKLQQTIDECSRYRSWSLSQRELQEDRKQQLAQQRLASRECLYQIMENTTPRRVRSSLKQTADYTEEIRRLEQEILIQNVQQAWYQFLNEDPSGQWSRLIDRQRISQEVQEKQEKEEQETRKRLYREELERLINEQKQSTFLKTKQDSEFAGVMQKFISERDTVEQQKLQELRQKQTEFIRYSLQQEQEKKDQQRLQFMQERQKQFQIGIMMDQAEKKDYMLKQQKKELVQKDLAQSYQNVGEQKALEREMARQRELQLVQESIQRSQKEEQQRQQHLEKIKYGYHQNEKVLQKYNDLYMQKEFQEREVSKKLIDEAAYEKQIKEQERMIMEKVNKDKMKRDTAEVILNQIQYKQQNLKEEQSVKYRDQETLDRLQQKFHNQEKEQSERRNQLQQQYRQDLIMQIEEDKNRKQQEASMSMVELNMNRKIFEADEEFVGVVPGLSNHVDHEKLKQKAYVNGTLRRSADQQLLRGRNVSAYIAGTNVTNGYY